MAVLRHETHPIRSSEDVVRVRRVVREWSIAAGFSLVDQTKMITAASEIARNAVEYGGGGTMLIELVNESPKRGVRLVFEDRGSGIADIELALRDGFTSGGGLGLGLGGARRLTNGFEIESAPGKGTRVVLVRWK
jgi:serine/threonine-protein kinase RsbT